MARLRSRNFTFTIHNQGQYKKSLKQELYDYINEVYPIASYIIVQELYPNEDKTGLDPSKSGDSHLQGNLYFKNQVDFHPLLKFIQKKYIETQTDAGVLGRTQLMTINKVEGKSLCAMDNYFKGTKKVGADPEPFSDMTDKILQSYKNQFNNEFNKMLAMSTAYGHNLYKAKMNNLDRENDIKNQGWSTLEFIELHKIKMI